MPFSDRWFYGDAVFIVDPWLWLLLGGAVMMAWTRHRAGVITWIALGIVMTGLVLGSGFVPFWARTVWSLVVLGLVIARWKLPVQQIAQAARVSLLLASLYIGTMVAGSRIAERQVRALGAERGWVIDNVAAMPVPMEPCTRQVIVVEPDRYLFLPFNWVTGPPAGVVPVSQPKGGFDPVVSSALTAPGVQGTRRWLRFPSYEVQRRRDGYRVFVRDARFSIGNRPGFGVVAVIDLDANMQPRRVRRSADEPGG
jgi:inner membrane protein